MAKAEAAQQKIDSHEELCAERYGTINSTLGELKKGQEGHSRAIWGGVIALLAWALAQVWATNQARIESLEQSRSVPMLTPGRAS